MSNFVRFESSDAFVKKKFNRRRRAYVERTFNEVDKDIDTLLN